MTQWTIWVITEIEKPLLLASANHRLFAPESRHPEEFKMAIKKLSRPWGVLDAHLKNNEFLLGHRFSAADLNVASVMTLVPTANIDISPWPAMQAWLDKCLERPAAADWKGVNFTIPRPDSHLGMLSMFV
ncbi:glutathione binding-like protein [Vibrio sp. PP-XX7]